MSLRTILLSILFLSCASIGAQESVNVLIIHQSDAKAKRLVIEAIDSITFAESGLNHSSGNGVKDSETSPSMLVYQSSALLPLSFPIASIEWMDFTTVPAAEFYPSIDLGLSVRWASFNIGATHPEEYGDYFAWGETAIKKDYSEATYTYYNNSTGYQLIGTNICGTDFDAAHHAWGGQWRLPTRSEIAELTSKCSWTPETLNGVKGYRVTGSNGNSIFLPAAGYKDGMETKEASIGGYYWSGNINRDMTSAAYTLNFKGYDSQWSANRSFGFTVRAVAPKEE